MNIKVTLMQNLEIYPKVLHSETIMIKIQSYFIVVFAKQTLKRTKFSYNYISDNLVDITHICYCCIFKLGTCFRNKNNSVRCGYIPGIKFSWSTTLLYSVFSSLDNGCIFLLVFLWVNIFLICSLYNCPGRW